ncbi:homocysteine S-methyltransferase family protein [Geobacter sulfurreducens]|uniref:Methionine synthase n=1 Tax=Geobacter sulfurreducens (strain ATCC 51573 / DSM 12127 / PCA) TaxID=243231 RepID=Q748T0_GEOSL|nr:homocysteine S-methyltransferase family protein [Geobacter sulfurreducens]AAR36313.1 5-methyltetrahydrofolate--homocysteine S-methyltransferase, cobalamin-dependent [Geobacter sulfurreducens PCA]UAC03602.1 homocysteine S-methyltransferase family protein [Geobacter sulfurreducens]HBB70343.1 5-methyltetrahydrofolate--homocysteine methyltransferase [Geobacter sulfurreducens]HCD95189.1 5-methyltetrahydrofolate--homocysteine methyltransferase [Geobacter sulfurreducens]
MKQPFLQAIAERVLVLDGAMGTMLQERGLRPGQSPEELNLTLPEVVAGVHREYLDAGADIIVTNTFGGSRAKLEHYGLQDRVAEINARAVAIAREVCGDRAYVAASIGPTGQFVEPVGDVSFDEMAAIFREQAQALINAGADLITLETFLDIKEIRAAVIAIREISPETPVIAQLTFDNEGRTVLGTSPEAAAVTLEAAGADIVGSNCGLGPDGICDVMAAMRRVTRLPLISQANAGLPTLVDGATVFPGTPDDMTAFHDRLLDLNVRVIGGCCGTTPAHIRAIREALALRDQSLRACGPAEGVTFLSSRTTVVAIGAGLPAAIIGERINPTGKKGFAQELQDGKVSYIRREALEQTARGAVLLDVNVGTPGIDEPAAMERAVVTVATAVGAPLVLDSSDPAALERGLKAADGKVLLNSVNGEAKSMERVLPLARKYGAAVIGLALDETGIPETAEGRLAVAERIVKAAGKAGIRRPDVVIDCLTLTVSAEQKRAMETLRAVRLVKERLGCPTVLGVSNISFGLPRRPLISSAFFAMALAAGLDAAIVNPKEEEMMAAWHSSMVLLNRDPNAAAYIAAYAGVAPPAAEPAATGELPDIRQRLARAVITGDGEGIVSLVEEALSHGLEPLQVSNEGLLPGLEEVGRRFEKNQVFLPQVMQSAEAMQAAFARLKQEMTGEAESKGTILMATVEGDIHDIGKNIVCTLLENHGFRVIDLGKNVPADRIVAEAERNGADAVGLSALMTTTMTEMENVLARLRAAGIRTFTMVGGAVVTQEYADRIGADLYARDAMDAVARIKALLGVD